jgi:hypothetical protein
MKVLQEVVEVSEEGLEGLLGKTVTVFCMNYIYQGKLVGVNTLDIKLESAYIVYETGPLSGNHRKDAQPFGSKYHYINRMAIESYGEIR